MIVGFVGLVRGHLHQARIHNRRSAGIVTGASFLGLLVLTALAPKSDQAAVSASAAPSAVVSPSPTSASSTVGAPLSAAEPLAVAGQPTQPPLPVVTASDTPASPGIPVAVITTSRSVSPPAAPARTPAQAAAAPARPAPTTAPAAPPAVCNPAYPDVCLKDGIGDYDCAGGSGNGPNYVTGPVRVLSPDPFRLDSDHDGFGCEKP
ncbi:MULTISPECIES: hypothetical protein [Protofrankia]|nr:MULTISPECIES: hypothetical protein [Protofrankia]